MSVRIKKSFAWIYMVALLIATMGVSVHQMYCYCAGMVSVSLFTIDDKCEGEQAKEAAKPACYAQKMAARSSCCEKGGHDSQKSKHGCTKKTTRVFQLKTEFTLTEKESGKTFSIPLDLPAAPLFASLPAYRFTTFKTGVEAFPNPPPPLSGRMICVRHGIARC